MKQLMTLATAVWLLPLVAFPSLAQQTAAERAAEITSTLSTTASGLDTRLSTIEAASVGVLTTLPVSSSLLLFHHSPTANPGEEIYLQGSFPATATVQLAIGDAIRHITLPVSGTAEAGFIKAMLPNTLPIGVYTVWVEADGNKSLPKYVNQALAYCLDSPDSYTGAAMAITGRNLILPGKTPAVRFVSQTNGQSLDAVIVLEGSNPYLLNILAPNSLSVGQGYNVFVSNGTGGTVAETQSPTSVTAIAAGVDQLGLGIASAARLSTINSTTVAFASASSYNAQQPGFQSAINTAMQNQSNAGGGTVVITTPGVYALTVVTGTPFAGLDIPSNVVLAGISASQVTIVSGPTSSTGTISKIVYFDGAKSNAGIRDLTITNIGSTTSTAFAMGLIAGSNFFVTRCILNLGLGDRFEFQGANRVTVVNNTWTSGAHQAAGGVIYAANSKYVTVRNNSQTFMSGGIDLTGSQYCFVRDNRLTRDATITRPVVNSVTATVHSMIIPYVSSSYIGNNRFYLNGTLTATDYAYPRNDGEALIGEQSGETNSDGGSVSSATTLSLTDNSKAWGTTMTKAPFVAIVDGLGKGQYRALSLTRTPTTVTLLTAWDIIPDATSRYQIGNWGNELLNVYGNYFENQTRGILFYSQPLRLVTVVRNQLLNSGGIQVVNTQRVYNGRREFPIIYNLLIDQNRADGTTDALNGVGIGLINDLFNQATSGGTQTFGLRMTGNVLIAPLVNKSLILDNTFSSGYYNYAFQEGSTNYTDTNVRHVQGSYLGDNTAVNTTNAVIVNTTTYNMSLVRMRLLNATLLQNITMTGASHGMIQTTTY